MEVPCANIYPISFSEDKPEQEDNVWMVAIDINKSLLLC